MSKTVKFTVIVLSFLIASFVLLGRLGIRAVADNSSNDGSYRQLGVYSEVLSRIRTEYVEEPNIAAVTNGALHGLLESLDANSSYLDPAEFKNYKARKEGKAGDRRSRLQALRLRGGDLGHPRRSGGQGRHCQWRHH